MAITLTSEKTYYKGSLTGSPPSGSGYKYGQAGGDGYGGAYCTVYQLKTTSPISDFTFKAKAISDNTGSSKYLGVYVTATANSAYLNCYGGKSGITTHTYLRFGWTCTNKGSFTSSTGDLWGTAKVTGLAIPAGTFYVYLFGYQSLSTTTNSTWYGPTTDSSANRATFSGSWTRGTYTISYNANGGTGAPSSQTKYQAISLTLSSTKPTKAKATGSTYTMTFNGNGGTPSKTSAGAASSLSYTFKNWNTASGGTGTAYNAGASYTANAAATLYAQYTTTTTYGSITTATATKASTTATRTISFDAKTNGGVSNPSSKNSTATVTYSPKNNSWYSASSGGRVVATMGANYTISSTQTVYAQWTSTTGAYSGVTLPTATKNNTYKYYYVDFDVNGGKESYEQMTSTQTTTYSLKGWYTAASGGTKRESGYVPNASETLYAQFNASSGAYSAITLPTPTRLGYAFLGWAESPDATQGQFGSYVPTKNVKLYAIWGALGSVKIKDDTGVRSYVPFIYTNKKWVRTVPFVRTKVTWIRAGGD